MTTFTHQLLSGKISTPEVWQCECEYSSRSATVSYRYVVHGLRTSRFQLFIQSGGKLDTMAHILETS